jgi:hypothetical protein
VVFGRRPIIEAANDLGNDNEITFLAGQCSIKGLPDVLVFCDDGSPVRRQGRDSG